MIRTYEMDYRDVNYLKKYSIINGAAYYASHSELCMMQGSIDRCAVEKQLRNVLNCFGIELPDFL